MDEASNATDESVGHPVSSVSDLSIYGFRAPCHGPLNLVFSSNSTPPPNHPHYNTREGTSTLGCESVNLMREPEIKASKRKYGITATKLSSPGRRARSLSLMFAAPHAHNCVYRSLPPSSHGPPPRTSCCRSCLSVYPFVLGYALFSSINFHYLVSDTFPLHTIKTPIFNV